MPTREFLKNDAFLTTELLKLAVELAGIGIWKVSPQTREVELTTSLKQMLGLPVDEDVNYASFLQLLHPEDLQETREKLAAVFSSQDGQCEIGFRVITPAQDLRWLVARGRAYFDGEGDARNARLFIGTMRDITDTEKAQSALNAALEKQEILLHEVNHRVKNSLQLVSSLLRLQSRRISDQTVRQQLDDATARISTIAQIHQRLYRDQNFERINFGAFLSELCADLQGSAANCSLEVRSPDFSMTTDRAISLGLVVNELLTNAFKYAYPNGSGPVTVSVDLPATGDIAVSVADEGVGLPSGFTVAGGRNLGMILVSSLISQLSGKIVVRKLNRGACFVVTLPNEQQV